MFGKIIVWYHQLYISCHEKKRAEKRKMENRSLSSLCGLVVALRYRRWWLCDRVYLTLQNRFRSLYTWFIASAVCITNRTYIHGEAQSRKVYGIINKRARRGSEREREKKRKIKLKQDVVSEMKNILT